MKSALFIFVLVVGTANSILAEERPEEIRKARYEQHQEEIGNYYKEKSPWAGAEQEELETSLFLLMEAEVGSWQLNDDLREQQNDNQSTASFVAARIHEEVLRTADRAHKVLRDHPNPRLLNLLIKHLEAYPYSWSQEGWEEILPNLKNLLKPGTE